MLNEYGNQTELVIQRGGTNVQVKLPLKQKESLMVSSYPKNDLISAIKYGVDETILDNNTFKMLYKMLSGSMGLEHLSGPVGIAKVTGDTLSNEWPYSLINFMLLLALLSVSLGANLLPLPMLDGGQFLFIVVEAIKGSINMKLKAALFNLSYLLIMILFVFITFNDLRIF